MSTRTSVLVGSLVGSLDLSSNEGSCIIVVLFNLYLRSVVLN